MTTVRTAYPTVRARPDGWHGALFVEREDGTAYYQACSHRHRTEAAALRCAEDHARRNGFIPDDER